MSGRDHITEGIGWREHAGDGPVLMALHGIGSEARAFDALAAHLPGWRVIAWEAPGYGPSTPLDKAWPVAADYAAAALRLMDALELERVHLLGHSLGTLIGAALARAHPERLDSLTLASCAQGGGAAAGGVLPDAQAARLEDLERQGAEAFAASRAARLIYAPEDNADLVANVAQGMGKVKMPGYGQAVRMLASGDLAADCAALTVPTSVIVGAEDVVTPPVQSFRAHEALPVAVRGALSLVPATGHALHQQAPQALAAAILRLQGERTLSARWASDQGGEL
ncbi:alpha/beta fold hydrolase [Pararhodobacter oceanensis]|uniref:Alpha/beta hydrolase n=1 Tax=Pararhodobacter oceanensis TaxID=2172121 RepID=A0A2T8HTD0_9RHOB|nr:alpha/beta hydrolase [Pararhodobacter oceanensis]PVH28677.1 alpha/beta hydrolase [Pararhodobacter oceanensis]